MANNLIQVKRTSVSGRAANSTTLPNPGELALNMTDGILYSTNGSTVFEIGANNTNAKVTGTLTVNAVSANGGVGANNQRLTSNGSSAYWKDPLIKDLVDVAANGATDTQVLTYNSTLNKWINQNPPVANVIYTTGYYGVFYDTSAVQWASGGSNTATVLQIANTYLGNGITRTSNNELQIGYAGVYQIQYSIQYTSSSNKNETVWVWLRKNGTDIPDSATDFGIYPLSGAANGYLVAVTPLVENAAAGDKYQIMWATSSNSTVSVVTVPQTAFAPATPGVITSVIPITNIITAPPGTNTSVVFNDSGVSNALPGFTFTKTTNSVVVANNLYIGNVANAQAFTVDGTFWANSTVVNSASFQVDGAFSANSTMVNAAALLVRGGATVNGTLTVNALSANGGVGSPGQLLYSDGTKVYWNAAAATAGANVDAQYVWTNTHTFQNTITFGNSTVNATVNSTFFTGTANNASYVGTVSAANVVSNAQLSGNLANYQTTAGLAANVATLTSNNTTYVNGKTEGNLNVNSAVSATNANNATYVYGKTEGNLNVNSSIYANNSTYAYGKTEGNLNVNNATTAYGKTEGNLNVNSAVYANNSTYAYGKTEGNLNVNSAVYANNSAYAFGKTEGNLNVNSAVYANNSTYAYGKTEGNLNVNNALTANYASYINANTGVVSNSSGVFVNSSYIDTLGASSLGGVPAANYVQNTDSRILSGNLNFTGANNVFTTRLVVNSTVINSTGVYSANLYGNLTGNVAATTISGNLTGNVAAVTITGNLTGNVVATTVNTATLNATANIVVGANVSINTSVLSIGNSTANVYVNSTAHVGNVVATTISGNLTGNVVAVTISGNLTGNVIATTISGNLTAVTANVTNKLQIGAQAGFDFGSNAVIEADANGNTYVQFVLQNANTGNNASTDMVLTNDTGNDSVGYVDLGINGSNYNQPAFSITGAGDSYLYAANGHLAIGTASEKEVIFHAGGTTSDKRVVTVNSTALVLANAAALVANGSKGTAAQVLTANGTGAYWSSSVNNALNLGGVAAASYQLNSTLNANIAAYLPTYTGVVNASTFQVGTAFKANTTDVVAANLTVQGNLIVTGTTVTLNTATLDVMDLNITLAKGTATAAAANGAGITVDVANATLLYINAGNTWLSNIGFAVGNSTSNVNINSTAFVGNVVATRVTANLVGNVTATTISGNLTGNVAATTITGNLTGNVAAITITGNLTGNVAATTISGNLTGNVVATTISGNLTGNVVATTVNATTVNATANIVVGANVLVNTSTLAIGNSTANVFVNSTAFVGNTIGVHTGNVSATTISGNLTGNVAATTITGNLTGNVAAITITGNLTGNVAAITITGNLTGNVSATTVSAAANVSVGANVLITTANLAIGNATANVYVNSTAFVGNSVGVHTGNVVATTISGNLTGNVAATTITGNLTGNVAAITITGNLTGNVVATNINATMINATANIVVGANVLVNTSTLAIGNTTANVFVNSTAFVGNTSGTHTGALVLGTSGLSANGNLGTAGHVLHSNGTAAYWATDDQGVTSVASGNGITGGTITSTGTLYVTQGTGIVVNATGVHVNASYIGTISSNASTFSSRLWTPDTRAVVTTPETLASPGIISEFKQNTTEGLNDGGNYFGEVTFRPYGTNADWSGGPSHQLAFTTNNNIYFRSGTSTTWGSWKKIVDTATNSTLSGNIVFSGSNTTVNAVFRVVNTTANVFFIGSDGNIGIGDTNPLRKLTVRGDSSASLTVAAFYNADTTANNGSVFSFRSDTSGTGAATFQEFAAITGRYNDHNHATRSGSLDFFTVDNGTGANRMSISPTGNVGIGTTTPSRLLDVIGSSMFRSSGTSSVFATFRTNDSSSLGYVGVEGNAGGTTLTGTLNNATFLSSGASGTALQFGTVGAIRATISASGNVGIGTTTPAYTLQVNGSFAATTKSFVIDHPTKSDMKLRYGSLEGPENGVYVRGKSTSKVIELPDYWEGLVDEDSITVTLTPIGKKQRLYVKEIRDNAVVIGGSWKPNYYYTVYAERKDVDKLVVEF